MEKMTVVMDMMKKAAVKKTASLTQHSARPKLEPKADVYLKEHLAKAILLHRT